MHVIEMDLSFFRWLPSVKSSNLMVVRVQPSILLVQNDQHECHKLQTANTPTVTLGNLDSMLRQS